MNMCSAGLHEIEVMTKEAQEDGRLYDHLLGGFHNCANHVLLDLIRRP